MEEDDNGIYLTEDTLKKIYVFREYLKQKYKGTLKERKTWTDQEVIGELMLHFATLVKMQIPYPINKEDLK